MSVIPPPINPSQLDELEALIREARARQRRRRMLAVAVVAAASGLAIAIHGAVAGGVGTASDASRSGALGGRPCSMANLAVRIIPISNPTGLDRLGLQFTNHGSSPCTVGGYPVLTYRDAEGTVPFLIRRLGKPQERALDAHRSIFSIFSKFRCDIGVTRSAAQTIVALPGAPRATVSFPGGPSICKPGIPAEGRWITLTPFEPLRAAYRDSLVGNGTGP